MFLLFTAAKLAMESGHEKEVEEKRDSRIIALTRRIILTSDKYDGDKFLTTLDGKRAVTPMLLALIAIGFRCSLRPGLDSGDLRADGRALHRVHRERIRPDGAAAVVLPHRGLLDRLVYLSYGLALILAFIGVKLVLHALRKHLQFINGGEHVAVPEISTGTSMVVIGGVLLVTVVASLMRTRAQVAGRHWNRDDHAKKNHSTVSEGDLATYTGSDLAIGT